jgi:glycogen debranching enzyme
MLLSALDESLTLRGKQFNLGIHCYGGTYDPKGHKYIVDFDANPVPVITYKVGGILFTKTIMMVPDNDQVLIKYELLEAPSKLTLSLKPFLAFRSVHSLTSQNSEAYTGYDEIDSGVAFRLYNGFPYLNMQVSGQAVFKSQPYWYSGVTYSDEYRRGFDCREDLFVPGTFSLEMKPGDSVVFSASVNEINPKGLKRKFSIEDGVKQIGLTLKVIDGAERVEITMDMLDEETREDIECGLLDFEEVKRELGGNAFGDRISELRFVELTASKSIAQDTTYTTEDMCPAKKGTVIKEVKDEIVEDIFADDFDDL